MSSSDFVIENGVLKKYTGVGGDVVIPEGVTSIGGGAFERCSKYYSDGGYIAFQVSAFDVNHSSLRSVEIPESVVQIDEFAFFLCSALQFIRIPAGVKKIGLGAFSGCSLNCFEVASSDLTLRESIFHTSGMENSNPELKIIAPDLDLSAMDSFCAQRALEGFAEKPELFSGELAAEYAKRFRRKRSYLLPAVYAKDRVEVIRHLTESGMITAKNIQKDYLDPAISAKAVQCTAFLLELKNKICRQSSAPSLSPPRTQARAKSGPTAAEWKSVFTLKKNEDGSYTVNGFKGRVTTGTVEVPAFVGSAPVRAIGEMAFSPVKPLISKEIEDYRKAIAEVILPEGLTEIGVKAFKYSRLNSVHIPGSVRSIGEHAFSDCRNLTIHAPAGSYAEQYAKENNIPFEAIG